MTILDNLCIPPGALTVPKLPTKSKPPVEFVRPNMNWPQISKRLFLDTNHSNRQPKITLEIDVVADLNYQFGDIVSSGGGSTTLEVTTHGPGFQPKCRSLATDRGMLDADFGYTYPQDVNGELVFSLESSGPNNYSHTDSVQINGEFIADPTELLLATIEQQPAIGFYITGIITLIKDYNVPNDNHGIAQTEFSVFTGKLSKFDKKLKSYGGPPSSVGKGFWPSQTYQNSEAGMLFGNSIKSQVGRNVYTAYDTTGDGEVASGSIVLSVTAVRITGVSFI